VQLDEKSSGVKVGVLNGQKSKALEHRCPDLGIQYLFDGIRYSVASTNKNQKI
jgi:3-deoxy-D-manno-octulosonate 8-phosphate phosphatase KdsC-like HAD superfamily phosphatase